MTNKGARNYACHSVAVVVCGHAANADDAIRQQAERGLRDRLGEDIAIAWHPHTTFTEEGPVQTFIGVALGEEESS